MQYDYIKSVQGLKASFFAQVLVVINIAAVVYRSLLLKTDELLFRHIF